MNKSTENSKHKNPGLCCIFSPQFFVPCISVYATGLFFVFLPNVFWVNLHISFFTVGFSICENFFKDLP